MAAGSRRGGAASSKRSRYGGSSSPSPSPFLGRATRSSARGIVVGASGDGSEEFEPGEAECSLPEDSWFGAGDDGAGAGEAVEAAGDGDGALVVAEECSAPPPAPLLLTAPPAQAFALSATPLYPNSVKWSEDNLLAVAAGHMVTILSPASLSGPRSFVSVSVRPSFDFGTVSREEFKHNMMLPLTLCRDSRAVVRSIDWSPQGVSPNGGCLLAVATTDYRVKLYSPPIAEYRSEWVELADLSDQMFGYCTKYEFLESEAAESLSSRGGYKRQAPEQLSPVENNPNQDPAYKRRRTSFSGELPMIQIDGASVNLMQTVLWDSQAPNHVKNPLLNEILPANVLKVLQKPGKKSPFGEQFPGVDVEGFDVEAAKQNRRKKQTLKTRDGGASSLSVSSPQFMSRSSILASLVLAWSPRCSTREDESPRAATGCVFLAVGTKSGMIGLWKITNPGSYSVEKVSGLQDASFLGFLNAHDSWVTTLDWIAGEPGDGDHLLLASGSSDGSVKLWQGDSKVLMSWQASSQFLPWKLLTEVTVVDSIPVTSLATRFSSETLLLAVGKGSGCVLTSELTIAGVCIRKGELARAHDQAVMGICWTSDESHFYSCGQDNLLQLWAFTDSLIVPVPTSVLASEVPATAPDLPASALESFYGVALSPSSLSLAMVRGIAAEAVDPMYQSRSQKGIVQLVWVGQDDSFMKPDSFEDPSAGRSPYAVAASWENKIISALCSFERRAKAFVLWDAMTILAFLRGICGQEILAAIFQKWLPSWNFVNTGAPELCCWSTEDLKACLPSLSCRCLQIIVVIFRKIILQELKLGLLSEGLEAMLSSGSRTQLTPEQQSWLDILWCVENELRERVMLLALLTALWCKSPEPGNAAGEMQERIPTAMIISEWVSLNSSKVSPQLLQLAVEVQKTYNRAPGETQERCSFCEQTVPLEYLEVGYCRADGINTRVNHRMPRCMASLRRCPPGPSWFCTCCGRNSSQQVPELFFSLKSRLQVQNISSIAALQPVVPRCLFCGILMHRILPEFFLTPALV